MKRIALILWVVFTVSSCSVGKNSDNYDLTGTWIWIERSGGFAGVQETPESTGETRTLTITDTTLKYFTNNELVSEMEYTVRNQESMIINGNYDMIITENDGRKIINLVGNSLTLSDDFPDGFIDKYIKQ